MITKIFSTALLSAAVFMGLRQGWAMINGIQSILDMFAKLHLNILAVKLLGLMTLTATLMMTFQKSYLMGNLILAASILMIFYLKLYYQNLKGAAIEVPFLLMHLLLMYFRYPLISTK